MRPSPGRLPGYGGGGEYLGSFVMFATGSFYEFFEQAPTFLQRCSASPSCPAGLRIPLEKVLHIPRLPDYTYCPRYLLSALITGCATTSAVRVADNNRPGSNT